MSWYFYGGGGGDQRGLHYQLRTLADAGLKATFFIEALFSFALGGGPLRTIVDLVRKHEQEIGLHLHPEWLTDPRCDNLPAFLGPCMHQYSEHDQSRLIRAGLDKLHELGSGRIRAFRAGNWGANLATLRALRQNGIEYDSSLNAYFASSFPDMNGASRDVYIQPAKLEGLLEFPVTTFIDWRPTQRRPLHVCAASLAEFRNVLEHAYVSDWFAVVIALHSFEFVRVGNRPIATVPTPQRLLANRFERLCAYLTENADKYITSHFSDLDEAMVPHATRPVAAVSSPGRTAMRHIEQLVSRFY